MSQVVETRSGVQYLVEPGGQRTAVVVPLALWETLLEALQRLEDLEDAMLARDWLTRRQVARSPAEMDAVPWETVVAEWDDDADMG